MKIREYYSQSFKIIAKNKKIILIVLMLYFLSLLGGLVYNSLTYEEYSFSSTEAKEEYTDFIKETRFSSSFTQNFINIFSHNITANLIRIISGILFGIIPILLIIDTAILNSYSLFSSAIDIGLLKTLILFVPHNIFEIPAFTLSSSMGLIIFLSLLKKGKKIENLKNSAIDSAKVFLFIILPLLLIAGIIESALIVIYWF